MIWSLNKYEIKKYLEDGSFRASLIQQLNGPRRKIQLILPYIIGFSPTHLRMALDTDHIGLISISNYTLTDFPACRSVQKLILRSFANRLSRLGSYESLHSLEITGCSIERIGQMEKLLYLSVDCIFRSFQGIHPDRFFDEVRLCGNDFFEDILMFANTQKVCIWGCRSVTHIEALGNVPYLLIGMCFNIRDYSCLGAQHYLEIAHTSYLVDEQLQNFGNVRCLIITNCSRIMRIDQLTHNLYITIMDCDLLREVAFYGSHYIRVKLVGCTKLTSVAVHGRIYSLHTDNRRVVCTLENCTHVDVPM
jgi:hypothetical protein